MWSRGTRAAKPSSRWRETRTRMKAAVLTRYGPPEVVRIAEVDKPAVGDHEVLVKVHVATVNRTDCGFRSAKPFFVRILTGLVRPRRTVLGCEFAGVVEAVGGGVTSFQDSASGGSVLMRNTCRCPKTVRSRPCRRT